MKPLRSNSTAMDGDDGDRAHVKHAVQTSLKDQYCVVKPRLSCVCGATSGSNVRPKSSMFKPASEQHTGWHVTLYKSKSLIIQSPTVQHHDGSTAPCRTPATCRAVLTNSIRSLNAVVPVVNGSAAISVSTHELPCATADDASCASEFASVAPAADAPFSTLNTLSSAVSMDPCAQVCRATLSAQPQKFEATSCTCSVTHTAAVRSPMDMGGADRQPVSSCMLQQPARVTSSLGSWLPCSCSPAQGSGPEAVAEGRYGDEYTDDAVSKGVDTGSAACAVAATLKQGTNMTAVGKSLCVVSNGWAATLMLTSACVLSSRHNGVSPVKQQVTYQSRYDELVYGMAYVAEPAGEGWQPEE